MNLNDSQKGISAKTPHRDTLEGRKDKEERTELKN